MKAANPKYCTGRIWRQKRSKLERCSAGNLDDLLWKYCKSRYTDLSCSDVHRMCDALRLGSEVCNRYRLADLKTKEHKCLKKSSVFILHFAPSLRFTLSLQSAFYTQSAFYPWSAVCSLQSAVCVLHWPIKISIFCLRSRWTTHSLISASSNNFSLLFIHDISPFLIDFNPPA